MNERSKKKKDQSFRWRSVVYKMSESLVVAKRLELANLSLILRFLREKLAGVAFSTDTYCMNQVYLEETNVATWKTGLQSKETWQ